MSTQTPDALASQKSASALPNRIPVLPVVSGALQALWRERQFVLRFAALPIALALCIHVLHSLLGPSMSLDPGTDVIVGTVMSLPYVFLTVPLFRHLLGQNTSTSGWDLAHSVALSWSTVKCALYSVASLSVHDQPVWSLLSLAIVYGSARFCLVVPAVAVGEYPDLPLAWMRSRGNGWRLITIRALVWGIAAIPVAAISWALRHLGVSLPESLGHTAVLFIALVEALGCSTLAHAFHYSRQPEAA